MSNALQNQFGNQSQLTQIGAGGAIVQAEQQRAIAEVQAAMMIAQANPRDQRKAMDRVLNACARPSLAEAAVYSYAKGGSSVSGPSIRLAEAIAQNWGNMQFGMRELSQANGESTVQAYAWDVETNTKREITFHVPHKRHTKRGTSDITDPREVYELVANQGARRLRACILSVIPGDVTEAAVSQCETTMHSRADTSSEAVAKLVQAFAEYGVTKEQIEVRIQRRLNAIQPAQIVSLRKIYASVRDGMSTTDEWFDAATSSAVAQKTTAAPPPEWTTQAWLEAIPNLVRRITQHGKTIEEALEWARPRGAVTQAQEQQLRDAVAAAQQPQDAPNTDTHKLAQAMQSAANLDALYTAAAAMDAVTDEAQRLHLNEVFDARVAELQGA